MDTLRDDSSNVLVDRNSGFRLPVKGTTNAVLFRRVKRERASEQTPLEAGERQH